MIIYEKNLNKLKSCMISIQEEMSIQQLTELKNELQEIITNIEYLGYIDDALYEFFDSLQ